MIAGLIDGLHNGMNALIMWMISLFETVAAFLFTYPWVATFLALVLAVLGFMAGSVDQTTPCASCSHPLVAHEGRRGPCARCSCRGYVPNRSSR